MNKVIYNRRYFQIILIFFDIVIIMLGIGLSLGSFFAEKYSNMFFGLIILPFGLFILLVIINSEHWDILIDYEHYEILCNIKFNYKTSFCVPFDSLIGFEVIEQEIIKNKLMIKKAPKKVICLICNNSKEYIDLSFFSKKQISSLENELKKVRSNDNEKRN